MIGQGTLTKCPISESLFFYIISKTLSYKRIQYALIKYFLFLCTSRGLKFLYDYGSIMHCGEYGFSTNAQKTIDCHGNHCGQRGGLSIWDQWEILYYYLGYYYVNPPLGTDVE